MTSSIYLRNQLNSIVCPSGAMFTLCYIGYKAVAPPGRIMLFGNEINK